MWLPLIINKVWKKKNNQKNASSFQSCEEIHIFKPNNNSSLHERWWCYWEAFEDDKKQKECEKKREEGLKNINNEWMDVVVGSSKRGRKMRIMKIKHDSITHLLYHTEIVHFSLIILIMSLFLYKLYKLYFSFQSVVKEEPMIKEK